MKAIEERVLAAHVGTALESVEMLGRSRSSRRTRKKCEIKNRSFESSFYLKITAQGNLVMSNATANKRRIR